ncbi:MAG: RAD55 family ATPase [Methanolinea sp.]|nr:RAD55 family ATPase [Methanolinea sp.]
MFLGGGLERVPEKALIVLEEDTGCMKDFLAQKIAVETSREGRKVVYLTSHYREDILSQMARYGMQPAPNFSIVGDCHAVGPSLEYCTADLCVLDPVSSMLLGLDIPQVQSSLWAMRKMAREGRTFLLVSDMGVLPSPHEQLLRATADGVIRFLAVQEGERVKRYIHVMKMRGYIPPDRMIPFNVTDEGLLIDTRERLG